MSYVSVAEHIANKNPPEIIYFLISFTIANFDFETFGNPNLKANFSASFCCSLYQVAFLNAHKIYHIVL